MKFFSHLNTATHLLQLYKGEQPFGIFIRQFFSREKKYGSKDRKQISHLCYCYFRLGKALLSLPTEERILTGLFFCSHQPNELLRAIRPEWDEAITEDIISKCSLLPIDPSLLNVFPWQEEISSDIVYERFNTSFFVQPDLFIRVRPGNEKNVSGKLEKAGIAFQSITSSCISLPNGSKIEEVIGLNKEAVIQDQSSQEVADLLPALTKPSVWDCCAASGGKSIMVKDKLGAIDLTVSDIRESILANLKKRFNEAGIKDYKSFIADLAGADSSFFSSPSLFDLVIADVPCTGSGTWGRTPEQLFYFDKKKIKEYAGKQKNIVSNIIPQIKPGGYLLYITCSVFKEENEDLIDFACKKEMLPVIKSVLIKGYERKSDTMFAALLQKPL